MSDRFLAEINLLHDLRQAIRALDPEAAERLMLALSEDEASQWVHTARDAQLPPRDLDWCWLFMAGRGSGKTHAMSSAVHMAVRAGIGRINLIAPTAADYLAVNLEGPSGILRTCGNDPVPHWTGFKKKLEWENGAECLFFSGEEPDSLRGKQSELCLIDEIAAMRYAQHVFDQAMMVNRLGQKPRLLISTTPKRNAFMLKLTAMKDIRITSGRTRDNEKHLSAEALRRLEEVYGGTRLARQELDGQMLLDVQTALFRDEWLIHDPVPEEMIEQTSVAVDPSGGGDEVGILAGALLTDGRLAILADRTMTGSPAQWGEAAVKTHDDFNCDDVVVEINFGGDMATDTVKAAAARMHERGMRDTPYIRVKEVTASRGKVLRCEPISLLFEKSRVLMRPGLTELEREMLSFSRDWDRATSGSPNRVDAAVWVLTRLGHVKTNVVIV
ncbi:DNA-packaging protein [Bradyrhizobium diazoefficiens]|nr:terminase family protein [Bradyrhizobium diazoefficiens]MBR0778550.1 DNA-packaging protein [Bradyrhizobium diazoefficiens]